MKSRDAMDAAVTSPSAWRICAVIITFNPDGGFRTRAETIAAQVDGVVVVDNGSGPATLKQLTRLESDGISHVIRNRANLGVATALNQGIAYARANAYTHALLFDHDTEPRPHMVATVRRVAATVPDFHRVAALGVNFLDAHTGRPWFRLTANAQEAVEISTPVSSGTLIPLVVAEEIGGYRDDFFIDHLEDEYCLRARSRGYRAMLVCEPLATHSVGNPKVRRLPWRTIGTSNHAAPRWYYIVRNHVLLIKTHAMREPRWVLQTLHTRWKSVVLAVLLDDDRLAKIRLMWRGLLDGIAGRTGELPQAYVRKAD